MIQQQQQSSLGTLASAASCQVQLPLNNLVCGDCSVRFEDGQVFFQHWLENHCRLEEPPPTKHNDYLPLEQCGGCGHVFVTGTPQYTEHKLTCLPAPSRVEGSAAEPQPQQQAAVAPGSKRKQQQQQQPPPPPQQQQSPQIQQQQSDGSEARRGGKLGKLGMCNFSLRSKPI